jgi:cytochrome c peroxidase
VFVNMGKAIAAYERTHPARPSRFDRYVAPASRTGGAPEGVLTADEVAGLRLFIGKANCTQCHNGAAPHQQRVPQHGRAGRASAAGRPRTARRRAAVLR